MADDQLISRTPLPWQLAEWQRWQAAVEAATLPHALMLAGPEGIGKAHLLWALASGLICECPLAGVACGQCRGCELLQAGTHPDFLFLQPAEDSRVVKIEQIRGLIEFAARTPSLGTTKVVLLGPAETMTNNAANALLKCLEEPSSSTQLLLFTHQPSALPATVRSRCQTFAMPVPDISASLAWLQQFAASSESVQQCLELSARRPLHARDLLLSDGLAYRQSLHSGMDALLLGKLSALEFPALVAELDVGAVLALLQERLELELRAAFGSRTDSSIRRGFLLRDELLRLQRSVANGANPNRQLTIEDCAARLVMAIGQR